MPKLTDEQLAQLQDKVKKLVEASADVKVEAELSHSADVAAAHAAMDAAKAKLDLSGANAVASQALADLVFYVDSLVVVPPSQE